MTDKNIKENKMKKKIALFLVLALILLAFSCKSTEIVWQNDFTTASELATAENKDLLVVFTGTRFDGVSEGLIADVFQTEEFMKTAGKQFVLLNLDLINSAEGLTEEEIAKYQEPVSLAYEFNVQTVPTIYALTNDNKIFGNLNHERQTKEEIIAEVKAFADKGAKIKKAIKKIDKTKGINKAKAVVELLEVATEDYVNLVIPYLEDFLQNDPENKTGKYGFFLRINTLNTAYTFAQMGDTASAVSALLELTKSEFATLEDIQIGYYNASYFASNGGMVFNKESLDYMQLAVEADPETEIGKYCQELLTQLKIFSPDLFEEGTTADSTADDAE